MNGIEVTIGVSIYILKVLLTENQDHALGSIKQKLVKTFFSQLAGLNAFDGRPQEGGQVRNLRSSVG